MPPVRRPLVVVVGSLGFVFSMVVVWLAAEGVLRLARVGPPPAPWSLGAGAEWLPYGWLAGGILAAGAGAIACIWAIHRLGAAPPLA